MMKLFYLFLFFSFFIITGYSQNDKKNYSEAFKLIEVWLDAQKDFEKLPGISAAIVKDQEILWSCAFGLANVEKNVKMEAPTLCSICSISKLFTSVAIMKLYDEGKLRLDDRIEDLLPWYDLEQKFPDSGPVTIRSLLTHSSGLPREANFPYWTGPDFPFPTSDQVKDELSEQETLYPASTWFQYSNLGMTLLGQVIEEVSGISYDEYIRQNILIPLGLQNTRTELPENLYGNQLATGYSALKRNGEREKVNFFQAKGIKPAAGLSSNVLDLAKFASWQFRLIDTTIAEILKPSTLKYMYNVHWKEPDVHWGEPYWKIYWGLGFIVFEGQDKSKLVGHGGDCPGYRSFLILNPESKIAVASMVNANGTSPEKYVGGIIEILNKSGADKKEMTSWDEKNIKDFSEYSGYYSNMPWESELFISEWNGKLVSLSLPSDSPVKSMTFFRHIENDTFRRIRDDGELSETLVFERNAKGEITQFKQHNNYSKKINY
jgi:CubicO group peptidase (beta-lactamase class C family)